MEREEDKIEEFFNLRSDVTRLKEAIYCYTKLYLEDDANFQAIAKFEGPFFAYFQTLLGESIAIRVGKLLDSDNKVVSLDRFISRYIDDANKARFSRPYSEIKKKASCAIHLRHNWVVHKNKETALGIVELPEVDVLDVKQASEMMEALLNGLSSHLFPGGIKGRNGGSVTYATSNHTEKFIENLTRKIKKANELIGPE